MEENILLRSLKSAQQVMESKLGSFRPQIALILGTGLGSFAESIDNAISVDYEVVPGMKSCTAPGHNGRFLCGYIENKAVIAMQGRLHGYEGHSSSDIAFPVRLMNCLGAHTIIITNASGAINTSYEVGDFCIMKDYINFMFRNPLISSDVSALGTPFVNMVDAFDVDLRSCARKIAHERNITVHEGVYIGVSGPMFESPAEICAFRALGADCVAMSAIDEIIAARHLGMRVLGLSFLSNMAAGVRGSMPSEGEVFREASRAEDKFSALLCGVLACC